MFIMIIINKFICNFINFCVVVTFLSKLVTLSILFSSAVRVTVGAKLVISGISSSNFLS